MNISIQVNVNDYYIYSNPQPIAEPEKPKEEVKSITPESSPFGNS